MSSRGVSQAYVGAASGREQGCSLRKGRCSVENQVYLITTVTFKRISLFQDFRMARKLVQSLMYADTQAWSQTSAYCVMPDHLHWLFALGKEKSLSELLRAVKTYSSRSINCLRKMGASPVWQEGFHDHALRKDEDIVSVARYVIANPLRKGLVERIVDYPHWDVAWLPECSRPEAAPTSTA